MQCDFHATHHTVVVSSAYGLKSVVVNLLQQTNLLGEFRRLVQTVCCLEKLWLVIGASCIYNDFVTPTHNMHHVGAKPHIFPLNGEFVVIYHGKKRKQFPEASNKSQILLWDPFFMRYLHLYLVIHWVPGFLLQLKTKTRSRVLPGHSHHSEMCCSRMILHGWLWNNYLWRVHSRRLT